MKELAYIKNKNRNFENCLYCSDVKNYKNEHTATRVKMFGGDVPGSIEDNYTMRFEDGKLYIKQVSIIRYFNSPKGDSDAGITVEERSFSHTQEAWNKYCEKMNTMKTDKERFLFNYKIHLKLVHGWPKAKLAQVTH